MRRFIQVLTIGIGAGGGGTEFVAGGLYLLREVSELPDDWSSFTDVDHL